MAHHHQLPPSPLSTQPRTVKKPRPLGPRMTTNTTIKWSSLEPEPTDDSQLDLTPLSWTSTPSVSTLRCATPGINRKPFTVTIPGGRHSRTTAARQVNREAQMCQADPTHLSIGQGPSHPSSSPPVMPIHRTREMPSSPLSHQLHRTHRRRLDSPQPPPLTYPPRALSLPPPPAHMPPQTMVAMLITPYGLVTRLITTTVPATATLEL
jgi:hypothetical protein